MRNDENHISKLFSDSTGDDGLDFLKLLKNESLKTDSLVQTGPYVAYVLQVEDVEIGTSTSWVDEIKINFGAGEENKLKPAPNPLDNQNWVRVYARITSDYLSGQPNIHAYLPMPKQIGHDKDLTNDVNSQRLIKMHHGFMGNLSETTRPSPGDFIWVDFLDKRNFHKPVYIKKLTKTPSGAPCLDGTCPPNPFTKAPAKGQSLNKTTGKDNNSNPNAPVNNSIMGSLSPDTDPGPSQCRPSGKPYFLKGYKPSDFTTFEEFIKGKYKDNMELTLCAMEVIAYHFENLYPNDKISLKIPKNPGIAYPPQNMVTAGKNRHHTGKAVDVAVYRNNTAIDKPLIWAAIMKLIIGGHLPDGGVGYFQTNASKGPNKGIKTTFSTNLPGSDWPHYDWDDSAGRPAKWIEATVDNKPVVFSSDALGKWGKAQEWASATAAGHTHMPAACMQALADTSTAPCASLPALQDVFIARKQAHTEETHNKTRQTTVFRGAGAILSPGELSKSPDLPIQKRMIQFHEAFGRRWKNIGTSKDKILQEALYPQHMWYEPDEQEELIKLAEQRFLERTKERSISTPPKKPEKRCGIDKDGFFKMKDLSSNKDLQDIKRLGLDPNFPPGFILDPNIMPQAQFKEKNGEKSTKSALGDKLSHISMYVIHETASELNMTAQCIKRKNKIMKGSFTRQKYATVDDAYKARIQSVIKAARRRLYYKAKLLRSSGKHAEAAKVKTAYKKWKDNPAWAQDQAKKAIAGEAISALAGGSGLGYVESELDDAEQALASSTPHDGNKKNADRLALEKKVQSLTAAVANFKSGEFTASGTVKKKAVRWGFNKLWHFGIGRAGDIVCMTPWNRYVAMSNWANNWAAGSENSSGHGGYVSTSKKRMKEYMNLGGKTIGQKNAFWGTVHPKKTKSFLQDELGVQGDTWQKKGQGRTVPNMTMMERQYQIIKWLDSAHNPFQKEFQKFDSTWYPCTINSPHSDFKTWTSLDNSAAIEKALAAAEQEAKDKFRGKTRRNYAIRYKNQFWENAGIAQGHRVKYTSDRPIFPWGRWSPKLMEMKGGSSQWKTRDLYRGRRAMAKKHWQKGVLSHARWGSHTDGVYIEYYCLGRELGLSPLAAFYACVGACMCQRGILDPSKAYKNPHLPILPTGLVYFPTDPDADYVGLGRAIWEGNARLRHLSPSMFSDEYGKSSDDAASIIGDSGNPVDWSIRAGSLYDPTAMLPFPAKDGSIIKKLTGPGRSQYLKKDKKGAMLLKALIDSDPSQDSKKVSLLKELANDLEEGKAESPGPFFSNSHYVADLGSRATVIPTAGWHIKSNMRGSLVSDFLAQVKYPVSKKTPSAD
jgi:hypothetical protein